MSTPNKNPIPIPFCQTLRPKKVSNAILKYSGLPYLTKGVCFPKKTPLFAMHLHPFPHPSPPSVSLVVRCGTKVKQRHKAGPLRPKRVSMQLKVKTCLCWTRLCSQRRPPRNDIFVVEFCCCWVVVVGCFF